MTRQLSPGTAAMKVLVEEASESAPAARPTPTARNRLYHYFQQLSMLCMQAIRDGLGSGRDGNFEYPLFRSVFYVEGARAGNLGRI